RKSRNLAARRASNQVGVSLTRECGPHKLGKLSALGHKSAYAVQTAVSALPPKATAKGFPQTGMSALPPKADMCGAKADVRFGPIADISHRGRMLMFAERTHSRCPTRRGGSFRPAHRHPLRRRRTDKRNAPY